MFIVPGADVLKDNVRPPPFEFPTGPKVTPSKFINPGLKLTLKLADAAPVPLRFPMLTGTDTGTLVNELTAAIETTAHIGVAVAEAVGEFVGVFVFVGELIGVFVGVPVDVTVFVGVAVEVAVFVGVAPAITEILPLVVMATGVPSLKSKAG